MPRKVSPKADGFGKYVRGGEDGAVLFINDTSFASSKSAWEATYPRIIIARASGYVEMTSNISASYSSRKDFTYIGFFAPGELVYKNYEVRCNATSNFVIRGLKSRFGDRNKEITTSSGDAFSFGAFTGYPGPSDFYIDHSVGSWGTDELFSIAQGQNGTVQYCLFYEPLHFATINEKGTPHGFGHIWGERNISFHHNLMAFQDQRVPLLQNRNAIDGVIDIRNNALYAWHWKAFEAHPEVLAVNFIKNTLTRKVNYVGNNPTAIARFTATTIDAPTRIYLQGNKLRTWNGTSFVDVVPTLTDDPESQRLQLFSSAGTTTTNLLRNIIGVLTEHPLAFGTYEFNETTVQSDNNIAALAGTFVRDPVDQRVINDWLTGAVPIQGSVTGIIGLIDAPEDSKHFGSANTGYPVIESKAHVLDGPSPHYLPDWFIQKYSLTNYQNYHLAGSPQTRPENFIIFGKADRGIQLSQYGGSVDYENDLIYRGYRVLEFHVTGEINDLEAPFYTLTVQTTVGGEIRLNNSEYATTFTEEFIESEPNLLYARVVTHPDPTKLYQFTGWFELGFVDPVSIVENFQFLMPGRNVTLEARYISVNKPVEPEPPVIEGDLAPFRTQEIV